MTMSKKLMSLALAAAVLVPYAALADAKFAYVDLQRALLEVNEGREAKKRLQVVLDTKQKELDKEQDALKKEKDTLDKQGAMMSEEVMKQKQIDLQQKLFALAQKWEKGKAEMAQNERTELQKIFQRMDPIIAQIAQREGFTMVFEKTDSGLVYAPASLDITNELVRMYNDTHKGGPAAKGTDAAKAPKAPEKAPSPQTATDAPKK
jgi:outer membrane protein